VMMLSSEQRNNIQAYLDTRLQKFTGGLQYSSEILKLLDNQQQYKKLADEVNSGLLQSFECLEDFKLVTLVSAHQPTLKSSSQCTSAVWNCDQDLIISSQHTWNQINFYLNLHLVYIPADSAESEDSD